MTKWRDISPLLLLPLLVGAAVACDKASPVAPEGTTLTLSANPAQIPSTNGSSTIRAVVRRANGAPVFPGTEVRFDTTLGTIQNIVQTNDSGVAEAVLTGAGRQGMATVSASVGAVMPVTVMVEIGSVARNITVQASPTNLTGSGGRVNLLALVRDSQGLPLPNIGVNFETNVGRLDSGGRLINTNSNGEARDRLNVTSGDISNTNGIDVVVMASTSGADGALVSDTFTIQVQSDRPEAAFSVARGSTAREVRFINQSTGAGTLTYSWNFGDNTPPSSEQSPVHLYEAEDDYTVSLTVISSESGLSDVTTMRITVPVPQ
jgi:PKD domain/Invasin, domain 3